MSNTEALRKNAKRAYKARSFREAVDLYSRLLTESAGSSPQTVAADRLGYASALTGIGRMDEAALQMEQAIVLVPEDPRARFKQGEILSRLGRHEAAAEQLAAAIRLAPGIPDQHWRLALELRALGRNEEAQVEVNRCLELDPNHTAAQLIQLEQIVISTHEQESRGPVAARGAPIDGADMVAWPSLVALSPELETPPVRQRLWVVVLEGVALAAIGLWIRSLWA